MYCPKCAASNNDEVRFCRACGTGISSVPAYWHASEEDESREQSLGGRQTPAQRARRHERDYKGGLSKLLMGLGFLFVTLALAWSPAGTGWWFWMLPTATWMLGTGVASLCRYRRDERRALRSPSAVETPLFVPASGVSRTQRLETANLFAPPSVTESTTSLLEDLPMSPRKLGVATNEPAARAKL